MKKLSSYIIKVSQSLTFLVEVIRATIIFIILSYFLMFHQIFLSPQMKRCAIVTYKHVI